MGENTTIKLQINDTNGKQITGNTKICIKINGKTYTNTKITNGKIQLTLKTDTLKNPKYQITIIIGENSYYYPARYIITLKINKTERQTKETNTKT